MVSHTSNFPQRDCAETAHLPNPANNHRSSLRALLQHVVLQQHVVPSVLRPELIVPEEIPNNVRGRVFKDSAASVLRRAILEGNKRTNQLKSGVK